MSETVESTTCNEAVDTAVTDSKIFYIGELNRAIKEGELCIHYQPRYDRDGKQVTVEALVRWQHPEHGLFYPQTFMPLAEEVGLIHPLGLWVFEQCCNDLLLLRARFDDDIKIAVNLSVSQLEDLDVAQKILDICQKYYLSLENFEFEITGCSAVQDKTRVLQFCEMLVSVGAEFSLEDFGTALTPLEYLCLLPLGKIKLESDFINAIGICKRSEILLKNLIDLAHDMNVKIVAEGVEHAYQRDLLVKMNCDQLQGFLLHRPVPLEELSGDALCMMED
jgi:EAL domain-containing protein (putative c-di-GMP-specific phosphodiesterase class I)